MSIEQAELDNFFLSRFKIGDELAFEKTFKSNHNQIVGFLINSSPIWIKPKALLRKCFSTFG
jgi:hypothetical protein